MALDLDAAEARIHDLAHEVDNVHVPVQYRAPVAALERLALALVAELRAARHAADPFELPAATAPAGPAVTPPAGPAVPTSGARRGGRALDYPSSARDVIREVLTGTGLSTTQAVQVLADAAPETFGSLRPSEVLDLTGADLALAVEILRAATDPTSPTYGGGEGP